MVDGQTYGSDVIILPDGVVGDWQRKEEHVLHPQDVKIVLKMAPEVVVIGQGSVKNMRVLPETEERLKARGIKVRAFKTAKACETYRELRNQRKVAAVLHVTC